MVHLRSGSVFAKTSGYQALFVFCTSPRRPRRFRHNAIGESRSHTCRIAFRVPFVDPLLSPPRGLSESLGNFRWGVQDGLLKRVRLSLQYHQETTTLFFHPDPWSYTQWLPCTQKEQFGVSEQVFF